MPVKRSSLDDLDMYFYHGVNPTTRTLWLGGVAQSDPGADDEATEESGIYWNTARRLILGLAALDDPKRPITIIMNSCGGDWNHGMAVYDAIRQCRSHVTVINMSHARSMTSLIFQAADLRITAPHSYYMIHDGEEGVHGTPATVTSTVAFNRAHMDRTMYQIYLNRLLETNDTGEPRVSVDVATRLLNAKLPEGAEKIRRSVGVKEKHIRQLCSRDTFFTPEEMVQLNFADRLLESGDLAGAYANPDMHGLPIGQASLLDDAG